MSDPFASAVISAYNASGWLDATLDSLVAQTDRDFDVVVVDDGSDDDTIDVAKAYHDRVDIHVISEWRQGAPTRMCYVGIKAARSQSIVPCDADDMATPDRLKRLRAEWNRHDRRGRLIFPDFSLLSG